MPKMNDPEFGVPAEADILDNEFDTIIHYMRAIKRHYPIINYYLDGLLVRPLEQWAYSTKLTPHQLRELGREMQSTAGSYLALGAAVLRFADRREQASTNTPLPPVDTPDPGWTVCARTVPFVTTHPGPLN
jgi:hypothetical protein